jgi:hypothetical protein
MLGSIFYGKIYRGLALARLTWEYTPGERYYPVDSPIYEKL